MTQPHTAICDRFSKPRPQASNPVIERLDADDATLAKHLPGADLPALLMTVAHLTGDFDVLRPEWRPTVQISGVARIEVESHEAAAIRAECLRRLARFRDANTPVVPRPTHDQIARMAEWLVGPVAEHYVPLIAEELIATGADPREPTWTKDMLDAGRDFHVAIIGAGESGLAAAFRLKQAGIPFTIYEKNSELGGTWRENDYPGCRVDINSFYYSYAFARRTWKDYYSTAADVRAYLKSVAIDAGIYEHIRFNTQVESASWDEAAGLWQLELAHDGGRETAHGHMTVFAVGQLNRPLLPDISGRDTFRGPAFHSAEWDHSIDFTGKRVAVIGTGASAVQFIKELAREDCDLTIFARTTNWLLPTPDLTDPVSESTAWLLEHVPNYALWYRAALVIVQAVGFLDDIAVDPAYPPTEKAVSARNDALRAAITAWMEPQFADRPDLRDVIIPDSPVGAKRIIRDNGDWIATLKRDNVTMLRNPIEVITETGIRTADGTEREFDVIIYGTGFRASEFLMPVSVTGRNGADLHARWQDDARAYIGATIPDFPNLFCMYGPNTNLVVYGSIIMFSELTANYIVDAARTLLEGGYKALDVRRDVYDSFNERVDERNRNLTFGFSSVNSWYKNSRGRVTQNYPFHAYDFWRRTHELLATDYEFTP